MNSGEQHCTRATMREAKAPEVMSLKSELGVELVTEGMLVTIDLGSVVNIESFSC